MLLVAFCISGSLSHELESQQDHLKRIYDLVLSCNLTQRFAQLLQMEDSMDSFPIKHSILKNLCLLTLGRFILPQEYQARLLAALLD